MNDLHNPMLIEGTDDKTTPDKSGLVTDVPMVIADDTPKKHADV